MKTIIIATVVGLLSGCGGGSNVYNLPEGLDHTLRIVRGSNPNEVLASTNDKGYITMKAGETISISAIYRFRSAIADKEKDEYVSENTGYTWLEPINDKLSISGTTITALKPGLDTLMARYYNSNESLWVDCKLEITVEL